MKYIKTVGDETYSIIRLADNLPDTISANVLGILSEGWKFEYYLSSEGTKYIVEPVSGHKIKNRKLWRILANTVYNPLRTLKVRTKPCGTFKIDDLKESIQRWLGADDDILTQFLDGNQIRKLLSTLSTFGELVDAVRAINGQYEDDRKLQMWLVNLGVGGLTVESGGE